MISSQHLYDILSKIVPLYVVMILAYSSVKWWKIFTVDDCSKINRFVVLFAVPLFSANFIAANNPYTMNYKLIAADALQKAIVIIILFLWLKISSKSSFEWCITLFSMATLTNDLVMGISMLGGMYGEIPSESMMVQLTVVQFIIWYPCLLFLFEFRKTSILNSKSKYVNDEEKQIGEVFGNSGPQKTEDENKDEDEDENDRERGVNYNSNEHISEPIVDEIEPETSAQSEPKSTHKDEPSSKTTMLIFISVCRKLIRNPNFYSSIIALVWSLIAFRWHIKMPTIVFNSIKILADAGLGMAMFSLGLFMASQPKIIAGGIAAAGLAAVMRIIVGPATMAAASYAVGLKGIVLQIAIIQAALPQAIIPFVFAQEYNVHPTLLSTGISFGMLISLPIALVYYILLGLVIK